MPIGKLLKLTLVFILLNHSSFALTRYVTATGSGLQNATSWANAAPGTSLQVVINASAPGDQVWVSCGTYLTTNTTNRSIAFAMRNGVSIYGGFAGTETLLSQRSLSCGPCSILSGEIGAAGVADNSYHVISNPVGINNTAIIDGFIIQAANDNRAPTITDGLGGGIYNNGGFSGNSCNPTIRNCVIRNNFAQFGAGIFNSGHSGGNASPAINNCVIANNSAYLGGGGIDNFGLAGTASPTLTNCLVYGNSAAERAGGMYCWGGNNGNASPTIINCVFANNSSVDAGGLIADRENSPGGSFSGNSNPVIYNSVFWGNTAIGTGPQFFLLGGATFNATYSDINLTGQNPPHTITGPGTGNLNINPQFLNLANAIGADNCWFTADDGLQLQNTSPLINAGNSTGAPATDIIGVTRVGNPDMGAWEYNKIMVNLHLFLQGYYAGSGSMYPVLINQGIAASANETDSVVIELHHPATFALIDSKQALLQTNGNVIVNFTQPPGSYYIAIRHRNTIQTWTANTLALNPATSVYNFSSAASQAIGDNQVMVEPGVFAFYTGDMNQDEFIDGNDFPQYDIDSYNGVNSVYVATDLNGDGFVDGNDFPIYDLNSYNGVSAAHP